MHEQEPMGIYAPESLSDYLRNQFSYFTDFAKASRWRLLSEDVDKFQAFYLTTSGLIVSIEKDKDNHKELIVSNDYHSVILDKE